ncbi:hypothetical protein [Dubosiella newyorkensis]|uniref:hypothetical protein n=1 Tax=Dubosiella newyorkensis TaxID=1862672 RepID=UPI0023F11720|nr:hypothetical protein [Dubosiella newyorkensis]
MKKQMTKLLCFSLMILLSACSMPKITTVEEAKVQQDNTASTLKPNDLYWEPKDPTPYIASTYNALSSQGLDEQGQAEAVLKAFLADFLTLSNKTSDGDIGGLDYIPSNSVSDFEEYAKYYYYDAYADLLTNQGSSALPEVTNIECENIQPATISYMDQDYPGFTMDAKITYKKGQEASDFKTSAKCSIIKMQDIHYVSKSDVTSGKEAGEAKNVYRVIQVE